MNWLFIYLCVALEAQRPSIHSSQIDTGYMVPNRTIALALISQAPIDWPCLKGFSVQAVSSAIVREWPFRSNEGYDQGVKTHKEMV